MTDLPFAVDAPIHVGRIGIVARDAAALRDFYVTAVGLAVLSDTGSHVTLGAGGRPLLEIEQSRAALPDDPRTAGLYHTAFLLPSRGDLGRWIRDAIERRTRVDGAADHLVSEAIYLTDPEGNGVEIYADRPRDAWAWNGDQVRMASNPLDVDAIIGSIPAGAPAWSGAPDNSVIGHVHLRVGDARKAEGFWNEEVGLDTVAHFGGQAVFLSSGGYHHHIGANTWQSSGAGARAADRTGLHWVELATTAPGIAKTLVDPWGTEIRLVAAR